MAYRPHIIRWNDISHGQTKDNPDYHRYDHRILAEGDSWFTLGSADFFKIGNLLYPLRFDKETILLSLAFPGDTLRDMADIANDGALGQAINDYAWHAILLSGGGNDIIAFARDLLLPVALRPMVPAGAADYYDQTRLVRVLGYIQDGYRRIVALRDAPNSDCRGAPLITHSYDYVTPRGEWLAEPFADAEIPANAWNDVSDYLLRRLRDALAELTAQLPNLHLVDTLDTLQRADAGTADESKDWLNEIHPTRDGYKKLAAKINAKLDELLP